MLVSESGKHMIKPHEVLYHIVVFKHTNNFTQLRISQLTAVFYPLNQHSTLHFISSPYFLFSTCQRCSVVRACQLSLL